MTTTEIDPYLVQQDILSIEAKIREVKAPLRRPWVKPMADEQSDLVRLRSEATDLYILRAWMRGRLHRQNPPEETRASLISAGRDLSTWDAEAHAEEVAERVAYRYLPDEDDEPVEPANEIKPGLLARLFGWRSKTGTDGV
jgi:hypothetical protein